jgi:hypothetical protein
MAIAFTGHSWAHIPQPLQYFRSILGPPSLVSLMAPSGQYSQQERHLVHFFLFITGRYVRQVPVVVTPSSDGVDMAVLGRGDDC